MNVAEDGAVKPSLGPRGISSSNSGPRTATARTQAATSALQKSSCGRADGSELFVLPDRSADELEDLAGVNRLRTPPKTQTGARTGGGIVSSGVSTAYPSDHVVILSLRAAQTVARVGQLPFPAVR
jgi:hypothetical protein